MYRKFSCNFCWFKVQGEAICFEINRFLVQFYASGTHYYFEEIVVCFLTGTNCHFGEVTWIVTGIIFILCLVVDCWNIKVLPGWRWDIFLFESFSHETQKLHWWRIFPKTPICFLKMYLMMMIYCAKLIFELSIFAKLCWTSFTRKTLFVKKDSFHSCENNGKFDDPLWGFVMKCLRKINNNFRLYKCKDFMVFHVKPFNPFPRRFKKELEV